MSSATFVVLLQTVEVFLDFYDFFVYILFVKKKIADKLHKQITHILNKIIILKTTN